MAVGRRRGGASWNKVGHHRSSNWKVRDLGEWRGFASREALSGPSVNEGYMQSQNGTTSYIYDPAGNLTQRTDPRNVVTTITYDVLSRVVQKTYGDISTP